MTILILVGLFFFACGAIVLTALVSVQHAIWLCAAVTVIWAVGLVIIGFRANISNPEVNKSQRKLWLNYKGARFHG